MQKITIDTRILVNGKMYANSTESAYINMANKVPSSYKDEKDRTVRYLISTNNTKIEGKLINLTYADGAVKSETEEEPEKK